MEQPTYVNYGVVVSIDVSRIPELKYLLADIGAKLVYQKVSGSHLTVIEKPRTGKSQEEI